jgi:hypothetical protein
VNDFNWRQTDIGVLMLLKTSKLMTEYAARLGRITPAFPVGRVRR